MRVRVRARERVDHEPQALDENGKKMVRIIRGKPSKEEDKEEEEDKDEEEERAAAVEPQKAGKHVSKETC
jgi:hypothetical protein